MKSIITAILTTLVNTNTARPTHEIQGEKRAVSGKMTFYTPGQGSCGVVNDGNDMIVAVSSSVYGTYANPNSSPVCQKTITINCNGNKVEAAIEDRCIGCGANDLDVSPAVFQACGALSTGAMTVSWTTT